MSDLDEVELLLWNPHTGNTAARILDRLDAETTPKRPGGRRVGVIVLVEVWRHHDELDTWAKRNDYTIFHSEPKSRRDGRPIPGDGDVALLLDEETLDFRKHRRVRMRKPWRVFSHDQARDPRLYERVWFRTPLGGRWKVTGSHWPTNGFDGGNRIAFVESAREAARALLAKVPGTVAIDLGDHNESVKRLRSWARRFGAVVDGHGPDSVIAFGATVAVQVGPKDGSDHHLLRVTATRRRPRWFRRRKS